MIQVINMSTDNDCYPDNLKLAEVTLVFKKKDDLDQENYRPVSVSSHVSNVFEKIMYQQIDDFMRHKFSNLLAIFRKNRSTQYCLLRMLEKSKKKLWIKEVIYVQYLWICQRSLTH